MKKIFILLFFIPTFLFSQEFVDFLPTNNGELVHHTYYSLSYNETAEQANWVFYEINSNTTLGQTSRTNNFRSDNLISTKSAQLSDYKGSGFDRGHLVPAADMSFNYTAMSESFYMSNMNPQEPSFNRGIWKKLESLVRNWGANSSIYVVTGPILNSCNSYIGNNNVCVPNYFYKVIYNPENKKMISFVLANQKGSGNLSDYVCTTDYLEKITNIDFFPILEDKLEEKLESEIHTELWTWTSSNSNYKTKNTTLAAQCRGTTQKGLRCKNRTKNQKGYCHYHD
ncbi:MAG: DNA/RNA non-specific endonuclease [Flavobacteriales bacterium]|jgi:endonuclease G, mitochondrial|nr:DNA/RNA non-specific endonuclease [Flavobacteriales bacterium]